MADAQPTDRALLLNVAYRLLGSVAEAEDAVQDAYARWYALSDERRHQIRSLDAWLVTTVSRICLDVLGSARVRRERYVGEWLPEPIRSSGQWTSTVSDVSVSDPADVAELDESLDMALLVVLERMTPAERVAFILHDVFGYRYEEIAAIVGRTPHACRQLASTARSRAREERRRKVDAHEHAQLVDAFKHAWEAGNLDDLVRRLDPAVVATVDGGGLVSAAHHPVHGATPVAQLLIDVRKRQPDLSLQATTVNGAPGLVACDGTGAVLAVTSVAIGDGRVHRLWVMRNPVKLTAWNEQHRTA